MLPSHKEETTQDLIVDFSDSVLTTKQQQELMCVIQHHQDIFANGYIDLGCTSVVEHVIELEQGSRIYKSRPYPVPGALKAELKRQIDDLLEAGIIAQSSAPNFVSPVIMVKKKTGDYRLCVDYRKLNAATVKSHQLLPTIPDVANILANKRYFTSLDFCSGY